MKHVDLKKKKITNFEKLFHLPKAELSSLPWCLQRTTKAVIKL